MVRNMFGVREHFTSACRRGDLATIKKYFHDLIHKQHRNLTPIEHACEKGHLNVVKYLHKLGALISEGDDYALRLACKEGHLEVVKYLVSQGANVEAKYDDPMKKAVEAGHFEIVKYLLSQGANAAFNDSWNLKEACRMRKIEIVKCLIENGADVLAGNNYPLHLAIYFDSLEMVKYLVDKGALITHPKYPPIKIAKRNKKLSKYLIGLIITEMRKYTLFLMLNKRMLSKDLIESVITKFVRCQKKDYQIYRK